MRQRVGIAHPAARNGDCTRVRARSEKEKAMLRWAVILFGIALIAALFGYSGMAGAAATVAEITFFAFLVLAIAMLVAAMVSRGGHPSRRI
jgi:uncharacterized membrane protein YtjA (UPF0391 family)